MVKSTQEYVFSMANNGNYLQRPILDNNINDLHAFNLIQNILIQNAEANREFNTANSGNDESDVEVDDDEEIREAKRFRSIHFHEYNQGKRYKKRKEN